MASDSTKIEWTDAVWNPVRGCSRVSEGCTRCYAERVAARFSGKGLAYEGLAKRTKAGGRWTGKVRLVREALVQPIRWRAPRRIFVNSMSDLFHESLSFDDIDEVFGVMHACKYLGRHEIEGHTFQVLTKRPARMLEYLSQDRRERWADAAVRWGGGIDPDGIHDMVRFGEGPHPRIWLGVSVENQEAAEERIPLLLQTPAAVRFLSCEPLIGGLDLSKWFGRPGQSVEDSPIPAGSAVRSRGAATPGQETREGPAAGNVAMPQLAPGGAPQRAPWPSISWAIVGGESGPGARPCAMEWIHSVMAQCAAARVPCFVKQMGAYVVSEHRTGPVDAITAHPERLKPTDYAPNGEVWAWRAGLTDKKGADPAQFRELRTREFPEVRHG